MRIYNHQKSWLRISPKHKSIPVNRSAKCYPRPGINNPDFVPWHVQTRHTVLVLFLSSSVFPLYPTRTPAYKHVKWLGDKATSAELFITTPDPYVMCLSAMDVPCTQRPCCSTLDMINSCTGAAISSPGGSHLKWRDPPI